VSDAKFLEKNSHSFRSSLRQSDGDKLHSVVAKNSIEKYTLQNQNSAAKRSRIDLKSWTFVDKDQQPELASPSGEESL
jgi:hypothetical protein